MRQLFVRPGQAHIRAEVLSAFLDNQVDPAERARVENHLRACIACRHELESLRCAVRVVRALPRVSVPHAFTLSESMVGVRRPEPRSAWLGGFARGLGAVMAVALVAVVATTILRQPAWTPDQTVARSAPTAAMVEKAVEQTAAPVAAAPAPAVVEEQPQATAAEALDAQEPSLAMAQASPAIEAAQPEAALALATEATESAPAARAIAPIAPTETSEPAMLAMAPPASEATSVPSAKASGMGGGAGAAAALPAELTIPEPTPPIVPVEDALSATVRLVYADLKALWAIDGAGGERQLAVAESLNTPLISPDGTYIVYRTLRQDYVEFWGVRWDGSAPRLLLNERELSKEGLGVHTAAQYTGRRLSDVRWIPGRLALALNIVREISPLAPEAQPMVELWELDIETDALRYLAPLGRASWPLYAPDGDQFALLEYGTEINPQGSLTLFDAEGGNRRLAVSFPASPAKQNYDGQVAWLPDSSTLWLAVPVADPPAPGHFNGTTLYRVNATGQAQEAGFVDAYQVAWAPDGTRLAYLRITSDSMEDGELYLADADGSQAQRYAVVKNAAFLAWAPDGVHFLYQDNYRTYLGAVGQAPQHLGTSVSFVAPRWVSDTQFVSLHDTGSGWLLTLRGIDGVAQGLTILPKEATLDVAQP